MLTGVGVFGLRHSDGEGLDWRTSEDLGNVTVHRIFGALRAASMYPMLAVPISTVAYR